MRSLHQQTILVTGATDGLGRALAADLAARGAAVLLHGRDDRRGQRALAEIRAQTGNDRLRWYRADLADLRQVSDLAAEVRAEHPHLDALVNNAGIGATVPGGGPRQQSVDGHELRFAVNHLAGYLLATELLPLLTSTAAAVGSARVVQVASAGQMAIDFDDVMLHHGYSGVRAYCQSKLAQIMTAIDLADQLAGTGVTANALHPATYMPTKIVDSPVSSIADGVHATARLLTDPALEQVSGRYFNTTRDAHADPQAYDPHARRRLRALSDQLVHRTSDTDRSTQS